MAEPPVLSGERLELRRVVHEGQIRWGRFEDGVVELGADRVAAEDLDHLAPCEPTKIVAVHLNMDARRIEFREPEPPRVPTFFLKPTTALNGHRGVVHRPADCKYLNYEGELVAVIGEPMLDVTPEQAWRRIAGFTVGNDLGLHDFRDVDNGSMLRVKGQDGFAPLGPGLVRGVDVRDSVLRTYVNGEVVQEGAIADLIFDPGYLLADLARHITLLPGDAVFLGTPANSRSLAPGDTVEVEVSGIGRLANSVSERPAPGWEGGHQPTETDHVLRFAHGGDWWDAREAEEGRR